MDTRLLIQLFCSNLEKGIEAVFQRMRLEAVLCRRGRTESYAQEDGAGSG